MTWWMFLVFPCVGAAIGAVTNQIAIQMLFRPYRAWYLGALRVPFTPGVIPAKRDAIAKSIAAAVEKNLISGAEIHRLITGDHVRGLVTARVDEFFLTLGTFVGAMAAGFKPRIVAHIMDAIEDVATEAIAPGGDLDLAQLIEDRIHAMDLAQLEALILEVTRRQLRYITVFGGLIGAAIGAVQAALSAALHTA